MKRPCRTVKYVGRLPPTYSFHPPPFPPKHLNELVEPIVVVTLLLSCGTSISSCRSMCHGCTESFISRSAAISLKTSSSDCSNPPLTMYAASNSNSSSTFHGWITSELGQNLTFPIAAASTPLSSRASYLPTQSSSTDKYNALHSPHNIVQLSATSSRGKSHGGRNRVTGADFASPFSCAKQQAHTATARNNIIDK